MQPALRLPSHALSVLGPKLFPFWDDAQFSTEQFQSLVYGGVLVFNTPAGTVIAFTADADVDTDGPGGNKQVDPWWMPDTALRYVDGTSCNSRTFPGIVTPPGLRREFGMALGDYGFVLWRGALVPVQVYDIGPMRKIGEVSLFTARNSGVAPSSQSDKQAATNGNNALDVVYVVFVKSGPGVAVDPSQIIQHVADLRAKLAA